MTPRELLLKPSSLSSAEWLLLEWPYRWFVMVRGAVLPMTVFACLVSILLAAGSGVLHLDRCIALLVGLTMAHATNNLLNDWIDHARGIDSPQSFRLRYGTHVLVDGMITQTRFWVVTGATASLAVGCGLYLYDVVGSPVLYLGLVGAVFVVFYTWPLKHIALGEVSVLLVWGPLMIGGSYFVLTGGMSAIVLLVALVYGIGPTLVVMGKHLDKIDSDRTHGVTTLPVLLGENATRQLMCVLVAVQWLLALYLTVVRQELWLIALILAIPMTIKLLKRIRQPLPSARPQSYPDDVWPLWYSAIGFVYCCVIGFLLLAGMLISQLVVNSF